MPVTGGARARRPVYPMGVAERLTGLSQRQIRYYEQKGLVHPERTPAGQRLFSAADIRRLRLIRQLLQQGHNATSIRILLDSATRFPPGRSRGAGQAAGRIAEPVASQER